MELWQGLPICQLCLAEVEGGEAYRDHGRVVTVVNPQDEGVSG